ASTERPTRRPSTVVCRAAREPQTTSASVWKPSLDNTPVLSNFKLHTRVLGTTVNDTGVVALVDTDRDELRERIGEMRERFYSLARAADPHARRRGLDWTVQQVVAHVLCIAHRYQAIAEGRDFHRAGQPRELDQINQDELEAAIAPIPDLVDQLEALAPVMDAYFDDLADEYAVEFHCNIAVSGTISQINWLFELVLHGDDIARATGAPWKIRERDMLFILRECIEGSPCYLRGDIPLVTDISVALQIPH